jgi:putative redox protein
MSDTQDSRPQAVVAGDPRQEGGMHVRAGAAEFAAGGPTGGGHTDGGANPYDLLSASLAACTAMTIRLQARWRKIPLSNVEVAVTFHHGVGGDRDWFGRSISLQGDLDDAQRRLMMIAADKCPVGKTLALGADIRSSDGSPTMPSPSAPANYADDLNELPIPNIDPD